MIWCIISLEERRTRGYLIQTYTTGNGLESIDWYSGQQFVSDSHKHRVTRNARRGEQSSSLGTTYHSNILITITITSHSSIIIHHKKIFGSLKY